MSVALHHRIDGPSGAPVLLLAHSLGTRLRLWDPLLPALTPSLRVVRFDHRGHGDSADPDGPYGIADLAGDVVALLDRLGIGRAHYCGVSLGGMVGLWLAGHVPERVERLVTICSSAWLDAREEWSRRAQAVRAAGSTAPIADAVVGRWTTAGFAAGHPSVVHDLRAMLLASPPQGYAACCDAIGEMDLRAALQRVEAPTLVVAGAQDGAIPPEHGLRISEAVPGARFQLVSPGAHLPVVERPEATARHVLDHLEVSA